MARTSRFAYSSGSFSGTVPGTAVIFFTSSLSGEFDISFTLNGNSQLSEFFGGDTLFTGSNSNPTLLTGSFSYGGTAFGFGVSGGDIVTGSGTITATSPTTVPEPGSLIFLGTGAVPIAGAMRRKLLSGIRS